MHKEELKDKCALCGRLIVPNRDNNDSEYDDFVISQTRVVDETIQNTHYRFDTQQCATMFKRFFDVYGKDFQPALGDK
jgi:hypothetical protein